MADKRLIDILPDDLNNGISTAETTLLNAVQDGWIADFSHENPDNPDDIKIKTENNVENAARWGTDRTIRAKLLNWLLTDARAAELVHYSGIEIRGAKIQGNINIASANIKYLIDLKNCYIPDDINCMGAKLKSLHLIGCHTGNFWGDCVQIEGNLFLRDGFKAKGELRLPRANIKNDLDCSNATFDNPNGNAIRVDVATINGNVFLFDGFSNGEVNLKGTTIHGTLDCSNAKFINPGKDKYAINAFSTIVEQNILLNKNFVACGNVKFNYLNVGGVILCRNGKFYAPENEIFSLNGATINKDLLLNYGFSSQGNVIIDGSTINGTLDCNNGSFNGFSARNTTVKNTFTYTPKENLGKLDLCFMKAGEFADNEATWPTKNGDLCINGFEYKSLDGEHTPISANKRLKWLRLQADKPFKPQPYEQLAKAFKSMGHEKDARDVLITKDDDLIKHGQLSRRSKYWHKFLGLTTGHGRRPFKTLVIILGFILFGLGIFTCANDHGIIKPSRERVYMDSEYKQNQMLPKEYPVYNGIIYSIDAFFPFVDLHQEDYYLPASVPGKINWFKWYLWFHIAAGWMLSTLLVASLTGIIKKE